MSHIAPKWFLCLCFAIFLAACSSSINRQNFDRVQIGMTFAEVVNLLGHPSSTATLSFGNAVGTSATWENRNYGIFIQFLNGQVRVKRFVEGVSTPREQ